MNFEDIPECNRFSYEKECDLCAQPMAICSQEDNRPEYHTQIYVQCSCGNYLEFELPVN